MDFQIVQVIDQQTLVIEEAPAAEVISVGTQGPAGPVDIGGFGTSFANVSAGDLIMFGQNNAWVNVPKTQITDGGNF